MTAFNPSNYGYQQDYDVGEEVYDTAAVMCQNLESDSENSELADACNNTTDCSFENSNEPHLLARSICNWLDACEQRYGAPPPDRDLPIPLVKSLGPELQRAVAYSKLAYLGISLKQATVHHQESSNYKLYNPRSRA
mmetsp:Transcript_62850/g.99730  ORF Transcript_62850/g.99730 Transcript_62850/m.99730 type:complete len:137 (-) Transcript_62850:229-639(-)|eukprot:CAMPEP_0169075734 /NCGR_PEP_ID=MMETSP1015-20121227/7974_1 /TAXON_ID=342587 /ORGANISM="Karlodinium micrum, Strain CCMP2283" /LENGTH=136 /DNA_ID=CAMNT_0009135153 /DNA_START=60 /DNA_END=470 /DNA_ORIENTATION=-